jgi:predicted SAM-dependent methyltransferase
VLNAGGGPRSPRALHGFFADGSWEEVRLDINPDVKPDVVGSIIDMRNVIADASFDAVWSSHNLEHLYAHEVRPALREFRRILKRDGFALITTPDLEMVAWQCHPSTALRTRSMRSPRSAQRSEKAG